MVDVQDNAVNR